MTTRTMQPKPLRHPPVVEAIATFSLAKKRDCPVSPLPLSKFSVSSPIFRVTTPTIDLTTGEQIKEGEGRVRIGFQYASNDTSNRLRALVRLTHESLSFHLLQSPYPGFDAFAQEISAVLPFYLQWLGIDENEQAFRSVSLRNVNKLSVQEGQSWVSLLRGERSRVKRGQRTERFISQEVLAFPSDDQPGRLRAIVTKTFQPAAKTDANPFVIVDVETSWGAGFISADAALHKMVTLRTIKNKLFRDALSDAAWRALR
ncbi:MAG TPA: TIGR04255 family protein [Candidatus Spyradenecus faecavium]|uniref:TIGR04255 family protein n=1 Tax=Candidatus Spyradenecus faecavium TaxID=2840947 RepID=A0A9D1T226_9BACT|nr:TIGR04255 family protein [Candidatus Spyradenecus faecavium]